MIIIEKTDYWKVIFQRTHAQLAADIAYHIDQKYYPAEVPFPSLLTAIADHDDGRQQWEGRLHITADGAPMDYRQQPLNLKLEQANKSIANSQYRSPWIGLLTSMHQVFLYKKYARENKAVLKFIEKQEDYQKRMRNTLNIKQQIAEDAYKFMQFCDELSLIICEDRLSDVTKPVEVGILPLLNNTIYIKKDQEKYSLTTWCFKDKPLTLSAYFYKLPKRRFSCDEELLNVFRKVIPEQEKWYFY